MSTKTPTPLVIGNWKMNPKTLGHAKQLFLDIRKGLGRRQRHVEVMVAPPFPYLSEMRRLSPSQRIALAAQDVFFERAGAYTGEVSVSMLKSVGVSAVIAGHSERRARGEEDVEIYQDVLAILAERLTAIVCVGEQKRDREGNYFSVVEAQLRAALRDVKVNQLNRLVIAYEPVWAIGTGKNATSKDAEEMKLFIQKILTDRFGRSVTRKIRILYGGSVRAKNATALLSEGTVDGFLIGGSSLRASEFVRIVEHAHAHTHAKVSS